MKDILRVFLGRRYLRQKMNYIRYRLSGRAPRLRYRPITVSVVATTRCTLSCDMCPTHSRIVPGDYSHNQTVAKDMNFELFKKVIGRFREALSVHIIGAGEPMLNKDFFKMVEYARHKDVS